MPLEDENLCVEEFREEVSENESIDYSNCGVL